MYETYDMSEWNTYPDVMKCLSALRIAASEGNKMLYQYAQDTLGKLIEHHGLQPTATCIERNAVQAQSYASFRYGRQLRAAA
ncbi:hypothetical protein [Pseudomonas sp. NPDC087817]|uniref:hypothetical protein n=1 Tax=Pseudomonas sp. NPDC087817 TaxID=3364451 RepID=UPI0037FA8558